MTNTTASKKIVLTGGHAGATAYALVEKIKETHPDWKLFWLGAKKAFEGKDINTYEYEVMPTAGVQTYSVFTGRIQRRFTIWTIPSLIKIPFGFIHSYSLLRKLKPDLVFSFGGFVAYPVVIAAWLLRVPVIIHEQTAAAGRANRYSSYFAKKIALSRVESKKYFPNEKCVLTGNPVSEEILKMVKPKTTLNDKPTILVTGGSRGSEFINSALDKILEKLLGKFHIIHQTGNLEYIRFIQVKNHLSAEISKNYEVHGFIPPDQWYKMMNTADLVVSRAGANMISELMVSKRPAILIPLPFAYLDEQKKNAESLVRFGLGKLIDQADCTPEVLQDAINETIRDWDEIIIKTANKESVDAGAGSKVLSLIEEVI